MNRIAAFIVFNLVSFSLYAQYTVNGNATQDNCHCYTLTSNAAQQSGSVWNNNRIDLNQPFAFTFDVFLGCNDGGADGISFVLQPISTSVGGSGSGMGYGGIFPGVGVTLDTYQNSSPDNDPFFDHIAIQLNGDVNHSSINTITPVTPISASDNNVEDCAWHILKITWDPATQLLSVFFDGQPRVSANRDLINTIFSGNSMVYWGFTGATGALTNLQQFCTSLTPSFHLLPDQKRCIGEPVAFYDSTVTFGGILKRYWNFGDGSPIDSINANPVHTYTTAGDFTVSLTVIAIDSCIETFNQVIRIGSKPIANFSAPDTCTFLQVPFTNQSEATVGTVNNWYWDFDNGQTSTLQHPSTNYATNGIKNVKLAVKTLEGCISDTLVKQIRAFARPVVDFTSADSVCLGTPVQFSSSATVADGTISNYSFVFPGAQIPIYSQTATHTFLTPGINPVLHATLSSYTCFNAIIKNVFVVDKPRAFIKSIETCQSLQTILQDSSYTTDGFAITQWWWDLGNGQFSTLQNPPVTYTTSGIKTVKLVVTNSRGCVSDTVSQTINVSPKPLAGFGFNANVCSGIPVPFSDSSVINGGIINNWSWTEGGIAWSAQQNPSTILSPGPHTIGLVVISADGCRSDTAFRSFNINPKPAVTMSFNDECKNTPVLFSGSVTTGVIDQWNWTFGDGAQGNIMSPSHIYTANGNYAVSLHAFDQFGCPGDPVFDNINIYGTNAFAGNDTIAAAGQPVQINASGGLSYEWTPVIGLSNAAISNPVATISETRTYLLKAFTPEGCESYDEITIKIYKRPDIYLPNAFTPNDDGLNDIFRGIPVGLKEFHYMKVYNRWGQEIFSSTDYRKGWDGTFKGEKQERGVYVIIISGTDFTGKSIQKKGTVLLIR